MTNDPEEDTSRTEANSGGQLPVSRSVGLFFLLLVGLWAMFASFVFLTNQEENVLTSPWQRSMRPAIQTIAPEQWGFFTKSPRDESLVPYSYEVTTGWEADALFPHSQPQYLFGLNRVSRAQGLELGLLYAAIADNDWVTCDEYSSRSIDCLAKLTSQRDDSWSEIRNSSPAPTVCGRGALAREFSTPWAYARVGQAGTEPLVILIDVSC